MKSSTGRCTAALSAAIALSSCSASMPRSPAPVGPSPLTVAACPELTQLNDPSFGATTMKLIEVAGQYRECRAAALAKPESKP